jgi:hypothetical protein
MEGSYYHTSTPHITLHNKLLNNARYWHVLHTLHYTYTGLPDRIYPFYIPNPYNTLIIRAKSNPIRIATRFMDMV